MFRRIRAADLCQHHPERICIIKPSALGDVIQTLPLLPVLKECYPAARIAWVINRELRGLVDGHPMLDESIPFDRRGSWPNWMSLLSTLRRRRFDMVFDLQGLLRTGVMTLATGAPIRVGLETAREGSHWSLNCVVPKTPRSMAAHRRYWRLADLLGAGDLPRQVIIATSTADVSWAEATLNRLPRPIFAVHPGARWMTKRWPTANFAQLLERLLNRWPGSVLILGSPDEKVDAEQLENSLRPRLSSSRATALVNLAGQSTLKQLTALLQRVDFAISNDSGPMHLAAELGTPTLGLFTCTSAARSGPGGSEHEMVSTTLPCRAGYHKTCPLKGEQFMACHSELSVERVWQSLCRLVEKNSAMRRSA